MKPVNISLDYGMKPVWHKAIIETSDNPVQWDVYVSVVGCFNI